MTVVPSNVHSNETSVASRLRKPTNNCPGYTVQGTLSWVHCPGYTVQVVEVCAYIDYSNIYWDINMKIITNKQ